MSANEKCQILTEVQESRVVIAHIRGEIENFNDFSEFFEVIPELKEEDRLLVNINSAGGRCDIGFALCDTVLACQCPVMVHVSYPTYSMGAILALCGDVLVLHADTFLMFHDYNSGPQGKGQEIISHSENYRKVFKSKFKRLCKPFLTAAECSRMFKGEDIYIQHDDPTLKQRYKRHFR